MSGLTSSDLAMFGIRRGAVSRHYPLLLALYALLQLSEQASRSSGAVDVTDLSDDAVTLYTDESGEVETVAGDRISFLALGNWGKGNANQVPSYAGALPSRLLNFRLRWRRRC